MVLGAAFLGVKVIEYADKFTHHLVPGPHFVVGKASIRQGAEMFYSLYFCMTGLHALHMIIGLGIMTVIRIMAWRGSSTGLLHARRSLRPLLALRRHRLDLPVPAAVPDRPPLRRDH